jgi:ATP-dependent 26S proteasome regulatory subunit
MTRMGEVDIERQRASNLWESLARKYPPLAKTAEFDPDPNLNFDAIGGLAEPKEEILTYACAATSPDVYARWGTVPPAGLLLIGPPESGKSLLAKALATRTGAPFLEIRVPRLVLQLLHTPGNAGELLQSWIEAFFEMPRIAVYFREVDLSRVQAVIGRRPELQAAPVMDFTVELVDRTLEVKQALVLGSTSHADSIAPVFLEPGRFERIVEVMPVFPDDVVESLRIHARAAEALAGRTLFAEVDWIPAVERGRDTSIGEWIRILHAVLRHKARREATGEEPGPITSQDLMVEVERFRRTAARLPASSGSYL